MENDFIELHEFGSREPFVVNKRMIIYVKPVFGCDGSELSPLIAMSGIDDSWTSVAERYEDVKRMLMEDSNAESND